MTRSVRMAVLFGFVGLTTANALTAQPTPPRARLAEDLRLDANAEDFSRVRWVYVGPREFQNMFPVGWKSDTLWVSDQSQRRVSFFGPDYKLIRTVLNSSFDPGPSAAVRAEAERTRTGISMTTMSLAAIRQDGAIIAFSSGTRPSNPTPSERAFGTAGSYARVGIDGRVATLAMLPWGGDERWSMNADGFGRSIPLVAYPQHAVSIAGDRVAHMWSELTSRTGGTFTVSAFRTNGDTMFVRTFPFTGVPIPQSAKDSAVAALAPRGGFSEGGAGVDAVASILVPPRSRLLQASAAHVWMAETDADGLVSVVRYRVTGINLR